jgi:uncharacterized protein YodC (DUF2158 family)
MEGGSTRSPLSIKTLNKIVMARMFIPGNWVKIRGEISAPKMQVIKYISKEDAILGVVNNDEYLECVWYENGERKSEIFHQSRLIKTESGGLFKT